MNLKVEWNKIVVNTLSVFIAAIIVGASTIVWKGATSVDVKINETKADVTHLVNTLAEKMSKYEIQLVTQSNQLLSVIKNQNELITELKTLIDQYHSKSNNLLTTHPLITKPSFVPISPKIDDREEIIQKTISMDIRQQLNRNGTR